MSRSDSTKRRHGPKAERPPVKTCKKSGGKTCFPGRKQALGAVNTARSIIARKGSDETPPTTIYKCFHCHSWHMTSQPKVY